MASHSDKIMSNYMFNTDDQTDKQYVKYAGGETKNDDRPTGGFPPIFIITPEIETDIQKNKKRQFIAPLVTLSIRDIMKNTAA